MRQRFVHNNHSGREFIIVIRELAAFQERNAHRLEIVWSDRHCPYSDALHLIRWLAFNHDTLSSGLEAQGQIVSRAGRADARQGPQALEKLRIVNFSSSIRITENPQVETYREPFNHLESRVN